jgi:hypothetical protein
VNWPKPGSPSVARDRQVAEVEPDRQRQLGLAGQIHQGDGLGQIQGERFFGKQRQPGGKDLARLRQMAVRRGDQQHGIALGGRQRSLQLRKDRHSRVFGRKGRHRRRVDIHDPADGDPGLATDHLAPHAPAVAQPNLQNSKWLCTHHETLFLPNLTEFLTEVPCNRKHALPGQSGPPVAGW